VITTAIKRPNDCGVITNEREVGWTCDGIEREMEVGRTWDDIEREAEIWLREISIIQMKKTTNIWREPASISCTINLYNCIVE
jgi:hypothetical protein